MRSKLISAIALSAISLSLSGCASTGTWEVNGKCSGLPRSPNCEIGGKIGGTWGGSGNKLTTLAQKMAIAADVADAAQFSIDVSGSTILYPATGIVTLTLKNTASGTTLATTDFDWTRSGSIIKLTDPDAVNNWALASGGSANELSYKIKPFPMSSGYGQQVISVQSTYEGNVTASASSTYYRCTSYPSPYACAPN